MAKEYIERAAALRYIEDTNTDAGWLVNQYNADWIYSFLDSRPAADVKEVVHGEWVDKGWDGDSSWQIDGRGNCWHVYECSNCEYKLCGSPKTNYCPNCGADMRGRKV